MRSLLLPDFDDVICLSRTHGGCELKVPQGTAAPALRPTTAMARLRADLGKSKALGAGNAKRASLTRPNRFGYRRALRKLPRVSVCPKRTKSARDGKGSEHPPSPCFHTGAGTTHTVLPGFIGMET